MKPYKSNTPSLFGFVRCGFLAVAGMAYCCPALAQWNESKFQFNFNLFPVITWGAHASADNEITPVKHGSQRKAIHLAPDLSFTVFIPEKDMHKITVGVRYLPRSIVYDTFLLEARRIVVNHTWLQFPIGFSYFIGGDDQFRHYAKAGLAMGPLMRERSRYYRDGEQIFDEPGRIYPAKHGFTVDLTLEYEAAYFFNYYSGVSGALILGQSFNQVIYNSLPTRARYIGICFGFSYKLHPKVNTAANRNR